MLTKCRSYFLPIPNSKLRFCHEHKRFCAIHGKDGLRPDLDVSGLPCPDMSKAGKQLFEEGVTSAVFCCHAKLNVELGTPLLIIENVQDRSYEQKLEADIVTP